MKKTVIVVAIILLAILVMLWVVYWITANVEKEEPAINKLQTQLQALNTKITENKEIYSSCMQKMEDANQANNQLREARAELLKQVYNELGLWDDVGLIAE